MTVGVFDLFKIGVGPSSSHTVGPMVAARRFLLESPDLEQAQRVQVALYGSLALTGIGHGTDKAILLGLLGETPPGVNPGEIPIKLASIADSGKICLAGRHSIPFDSERDLLWHKNENLPGHTNGMRFTLTYGDGRVRERVFYSIGGGFVRAEDDPPTAEDAGPTPAPYPFASMDELLRLGRRNNLSIAAMQRANELAHCSPEALDAGLDTIWKVMGQCVESGLNTSGELPGGLHVKRRAATLWNTAQRNSSPLPNDAMHRVSLYAMAVNEENAAGGRVVTAPTNGSAGIVPAVLRYFLEECRSPDPEMGVRDFLLVAAAIGLLCKRNASISGAEIGCQGEVGVACAMAAAGLTAALGGSNEQVECAAEIAIEHHLGMTCDPIAGLVQIPCIERNGMGAVKAITAASLAINSDGSHHVSLDQVIATMRQTGTDMQAKYKETSLGGLAIHVAAVSQPEC